MKNVIDYFMSGFLALSAVWMLVFAVLLAFYAEAPSTGSSFFNSVVRPLGVITLSGVFVGFLLMSYDVAKRTLESDS